MSYNIMFKKLIYKQYFVESLINSLVIKFDKNTTILKK